MSRLEIQRGLSGVLRDVFEDESIEARDELTAGDVAQWDSLNHVTLIVAVEKKFGIRFTTREVSSLKNVGELIDLIHGKTEQ